MRSLLLGSVLLAGTVCCTATDALDVPRGQGFNVQPPRPSPNGPLESRGYAAWDGLWGVSMSGDSEIRIPSFLQTGPIRGIMKGDVEFGTIYEGVDDLSLTLRQYRLESTLRPYDWLLSAAAANVTEVTYKVDKDGFGVVSGYIDDQSAHAYYGICRVRQGELQCVDFFWDTVDQTSIAPLIEGVVSSFNH